MSLKECRTRPAVVENLGGSLCPIVDVFFPLLYELGGKREDVMPDGNRLSPPWTPATPGRHKSIAGHWCLGRGKGERLVYGPLVSSLIR